MFANGLLRSSVKMLSLFHVAVGTDLAASLIFVDADVKKVGGYVFRDFYLIISPSAASEANVTRCIGIHGLRRLPVM